MLSKFICAAMLAASGASAHSIQAREAQQAQQSQPFYKVNRDSEYGAPSAPSYSAPAPSYSAPEATYGAPSTGYGTAYEEEAGLDLTSIIIPLLALVGLSLLFPTYVSLTTVRKRREAGDEQGKGNWNRIFLKFALLLFPLQIIHLLHSNSLSLYTTLLLRNSLTLLHYYVQQNSLRSCYDRWSGPWCPCPYPT